MIGIIQEHFTIEQLAKIDSISSRNDVILFTDSRMPANDFRNIATTSVSRSFEFEGTLVSTCYRSTEYLLNNRSAKRKIFYATDLEWTKHNNLPYDKPLRIYNSEDIEVIASSQDIYDNIKTFFKKPKGVMEDWDLEQISKDT